MRTHRYTLPLLILPVLLSGCLFGDEQSELRAWMEETKKSTPLKIERVSEPKKFEPFVYASNGVADPFDSVKLITLLQRLAEKGGKGKKPDMERRREALEAFPLDTIKMIGVMQQKGLSYALLKADKTTYMAKIGNYIGQNFGMITAITETEVKIKELVQDAAGDWVERETNLQLLEGSK